MIRTKLFTACALAFAVSLVGTAASAQEPTNQITFFTFSAPFELPGGKTLPAGKYVFKIVDSPSNRHVVQVMSEDQQTMHATLLAIPAQRQDPADEPEVRFMETEANMAPAVRTWWYPGRTIGHEFIYPKDHARRLAARQSEGVLTVAGDATGDDAMRTADLARIGATGEETAVTAETTTAAKTESQTSTAAQTAAAAQPSATTQPSATPEPTPAPQTPSAAQTATSAQTTTPSAVNSSTQSTAGESTSPTQTAERPAQAETPATTARNQNARTELPRTASTLPLIGLLGLASLIGAGALRLWR
jgi:hypothetical protein